MARRAFSLTELMVTLAIICVLVLIVVPKLLDAQRRAKRSEVVVNTNGLFKVVHVYAETEHDGTAVLNTGFNPSPQPSAAGLRGGMPRPWNTGISEEQAATWGLLGWSPDGAVRCSYQAWIGPEKNDHWVIGDCDIDDDGEPVQSIRLGKGALRGLGLRGGRQDLFPEAF